ncbi:hypothetical protein CsSME_00022364 [Camellia sinensis var. sinensis]
MAEGEKRKKQGQYDAVSGTRKKARQDGNGEQTEVKEEEVEEFFAIIRRIHVAVKYFERGSNGDGRKLTEMRSRLRQSIERECAGGVNGAKSKVREEGVEENLGLDLNAEPGSE